MTKQEKYQPGTVVLLPFDRTTAATLSGAVEYPPQLDRIEDDKKGPFLYQLFWFTGAHLNECWVPHRDIIVESTEEKVEREGRTKLKEYSTKLWGPAGVSITFTGSSKEAVDSVMYKSLRQDIISVASDYLTVDIDFNSPLIQVDVTKKPEDQSLDDYTADCATKQAKANPEDIALNQLASVLRCLKSDSYLRTNPTERIKSKLLLLDKVANNFRTLYSLPEIKLIGKGLDRAILFDESPEFMEWLTKQLEK